MLFGRYIFKYGSSLYYPPMEFVDSFITYQDNFLPFAANPNIPASASETARPALLSQDYLTPYWNPQWAAFASTSGLEGDGDAADHGRASANLSSQFSFVESLPDLSAPVENLPWLAAPLHWPGQSRLAFGSSAAPACRDAANSSRWAAACTSAVSIWPSVRVVVSGSAASNGGCRRRAISISIFATTL